MSLETWVGLMRNGLCVVSDTMPDRFDQLGRYASLNGMSTMNLLIAPLQVAAVVFNVPGALGLPGAVAAWAKSGGVGHLSQSLSRLGPHPTQDAPHMETN